MQRWVLRYFIALGVAVALYGCSDVTNVAPSDTQAFSFGDYFWPSGSHSLTVLHDAATNTWQLADSSGHRVLTRGGSRISFTDTDQSVLATGFEAGTLFDLDPGTYFSATESLVTFVNRLRVAAFVESSGALYVGTDSGVFVRDASASAFHYAGLAGRVDALGQNPAKGVLFVGLDDGTLWSGTSASWTPMSHTGLPNGAITALAFGVDQALYAAVAGTPGFYRYTDAAAWQQVPYMQSASIRRLQPFYYTAIPKVAKCIVAATANGEIGVFNVDGSQNPDPTQVAATIEGFAIGADGALLAATDAGVLSGDVHNNVWSPLATPVTSPTTAIHTWYPGAGSPILYFSAEARVSTANLTGGDRSDLASVPNGPVLALGHFGSRLYALTDRTCYEYQSTWSEVPGLGLESIVRNVGPLVLAHDPLRVGDSWHAGTLAVPEANHTYSFAARVLTHYDTLHVGEATYPDVLVVRYGHEDVTGALTSGDLPYFVIYYAKGYGIAMAEKVRRDSIESRQVVTDLQ